MVRMKRVELACEHRRAGLGVGAQLREPRAEQGFDPFRRRAGPDTIAFGQPPCPSGSQVMVDGAFRRVKQVSGHTFYDQIDARRVMCR